METGRKQRLPHTAHWEPTGIQTAEFCFHKAYRNRDEENLKQKEKRKKKRSCHSPVKRKEMKNAHVMKQDSIPWGKGIHQSENWKPLYHIPNLQGRYSEMILTITLKTHTQKNKYCNNRNI